MDHLSNMQTFVSVVDAGSFSEAARRLALAKSVVSKRVKLLEEQLGTQLLNRSTRRLDITDAGAVYYRQCVKIIAQIEEAEAQINIMSAKPSGCLHVSCVACFAVSYLGRDLCEFHARYPEIAIELIQTNRMVDPTHGGYDLCIQMLDVPSIGVEKKIIASARHLLVGSPKYFERQELIKHPNDLIKHRCAHNVYFGPEPEWTFYGENGPIMVGFEPVMQTNNCWLAKDAALNGNCIALLPLFFIDEELAEGSLEAIFTEYQIGDTWLAAYFLQREYVPLKVKLFLDFLEEKYTPVPPWEKKLSNINNDRYLNFQ